MYTQSDKAIQFATTSLTKLVIYFNNGTNHKYYSRDQKSKYDTPRKELGIFRFNKMLNKEETMFANNRNGVKLAILYCNITNAELQRFKNGAWE